MLHPVDLDWAVHGYLWSPDHRRLRHVIGLDHIARDALAAGVHASWAELPGTCAGWCDCRRRSIVLAPWLFAAHPAVLRDVLTHELAHALTGPSDARARCWQMRCYGELICLDCAP